MTLKTHKKLGQLKAEIEAMLETECQEEAREALLRLYGAAADAIPVCEQASFRTLESDLQCYQVGESDLREALKNTRHEIVARDMQDRIYDRREVIRILEPLTVTEREWLGDEYQEIRHSFPTESLLLYSPYYGRIEKYRAGE